MGRERNNTFRKALRHLKSSQIDEKLQLLSEIPTNNTTGIYVIEPESIVQDPDIPGEVTREANFDQDALNNGRDTTGLFDVDNTTILTIEPPGDTTYILGPMSAMWYAWGNFSTIGYIRQSDRRMVDLGRITGQLGSWNGSSNFTSYGQLSLEQAVWFRDTPKLNGADNDTPNYRAFYPGPPSNAPDQYGRYLCVITGTTKETTVSPPPRRVPPVMGNPNDAGYPWGLLDKLGINPGTLGQLGADLLRAFTDSSRFAGDFMFKGLPKGVDYLPNFTGAAQKGLAAALTGGKKWADVFGDFGKTLAGKNYATQYFTPSLEKSLDYAKAGGTVVVMPSTPGVQGLKNWFGGGISRGFALGEVEKLVRTSDTIQSFNQGTTQIFNLANPNSMVELQKLAAQGAKTNTMLGKLGRAVPFVGAAAAIADVGMRIQSGDYAGAVLGGVSAIPGPIGWAGLGLQVLYDTTAPQGIKNYLNKDLPKFYGLSNSIQIKGNFIIEQKEDEYLNSMRQALFELGVPKNRKEYAAQQGTLLSLMDVNPQLVSIIVIALAGESFSPEQQQWIKNNMIPMVEMFSALRKIQASGENSGEVKEAFVLSQNRRRILHEIKKPYILSEQPKQKYKIKLSHNNKNINVDLMKKAEVPSSFKKAEDKMWGKYEKEQNARMSQERKNEVLDHLGGSDHFWEFMTETSRSKNKDIQYTNFDDKSEKVKGKIVRKEELKGDHLVFLKDEKTNEKKTMLQSEINELLAQENMPDEFKIFFEQQNETERYDQDPLFKKVSKRLKKEIDYPDKPAKNGYPNDPPPEMVNGMHPDLVDGKKTADRFNRLDPQSAKSMPSTGNPHIDKKVKAATKKPK